MLVGEPGIGKTRTAQELVAHAETQGGQVLWGWCYEGEGAPPFWPWLQPIHAYVQRRDPEQLRSEMGPRAADIAEVVSEVRGKLPNLDPPPARAEMREEEHGAFFRRHRGVWRVDFLSREAYKFITMAPCNR
jgi:hypothetical protein